MQGKMGCALAFRTGEFFRYIHRTKTHHMASKTDRIEIYRSRKVKSQFGWRYKTRNGKKVAASGELYTNHSHALKMVEYLFAAAIASGKATIVDTTKA